MLAKTLRDDQALAIQEIRDGVMEDAGEKRPSRTVLQAPTGAGKTVIMADITSRARSRDKKVLITVPAISLVDQTLIALAAQGIMDVGVIQATHRMTDLSQPVQVCSVQTLEHRWQKEQMPKADLVLVDEVHRMFELFSNWIPDPAWQEVPFVGFSATPWSKGLGTMYDRLVQGSTIKELIAMGVLVPFRTFAPDMPDLSGVRTVAGDFVQAELDEVMRPKTLVANIVETWMELARDRPTVCFCCSRAHADQVAKEFEGAGVGAAYMDCETKMLDWRDDEGVFHEGRNTIRKRMLEGEIRVVCNVEVVGIGVDWPEVSCIIYARPTKSDMRFVQNIGRGLRATKGKTELLILDHSTTTARLGFVDEVYSYHDGLDDGQRKAKGEVGVALPKECPGCHLLKPPRTAECPHCGFKVEAHADPVLVERGTLRELRPGDEIEDWRRRLPEKPYVFGQLWYWAKQKGYKPGYAAVKTKEIFGSFPRAREPDPETIGPAVPELLAYLIYSTDKWKKERLNERRREARKLRSFAEPREDMEEDFR